MITRLRVSREMHERAKVCAESIDESLCEWVRRCIVQWKKGILHPVPELHDFDSTTYQGAVISIYQTGLEPEVVRDAIAAGIIFCESRRPAPFKPAGVEGVDYLVEVEA